MKATYGEVLVKVEEDDTDPENYIPQGYITEKREIFKDPITDDGTKRSKKGLLKVSMNDPGDGNDFKLIVEDQCNWEQEGNGLLQIVFKDGKLYNEVTLDQIRERIKNS